MDLETVVKDFEQHLDAYPELAGQGRGNEEGEDDPQEHHYFYWDRTNRWGQKERVVFWLMTDKTRWFLKKRKNGKVVEENGTFFGSTITALDMLHKFFIDVEE